MGELHLAAYHGDSEWVKACLLAGADPNEYDESGYGPLHWAAFKGMVGSFPVESARLLLEAGADVEATTRHEVGSSALVLACQAGALEIVRLLVDAGADINARCGNVTPLIAAANSGCAEAVRLLLSRGAERMVKGPFGMTALEWAESNGFDEVLAALHAFNERDPSVMDGTEKSS